MPLQRGSSVGRYEIVMRLGAGGMGEVYRARDPRLGRDIAIKVLSDEASRDRDRLRRFMAEAKAASALNHPNILTVHEIGETPSGPYIVTELVEGSTVRELLAEGSLALDRALDIAIQAADGIAKAHEAGIVHRDLKPENLMVTRDGFVKILDFGLAKLLRPVSGEFGAAGDQSSTATGMIVGTAGYLSPEQLRGGPADSRSDLFALGVVLYEMVTGQNPFHRDNAADTFSAILRDEPAPLSTRLAAAQQELSDAVRQALSKKPEDRHASARQLAAELKRIRAGVESSRSGTQVVPARLGAARSPRRRVLSLLVPVATLVGLALLVLARRGGNPAAVSLPANQLAVAVLPIQDASEDKELAKAGIGRILADAFVQILSDIPKVYVVSPIRLNEMARFEGRSLADASYDLSLAAKVCKRSGADAMLSGRLSRVGRVYILDAELTRLPDTLLGKFRASSEGAERLLPALIEGVSTKIQEKLGAPNAPRGLDNVATTNVKAYEHYVRGLEANMTADWKRAIPDLEKALELDPQMGLAWSELGCAYSFVGDNAKAEAAQRKAEEFLHRVNRKERMWIEANGIWIRTKSEQLFRKASEKFIREFPDDRQGYFYMGLAAEYLGGDCKDALTWYEKSYALSPGYYPITNAMADCHVKLGQKARAAQVLHRYLKLPAGDDLGRQRAQSRLAELKEKW